MSISPAISFITIPPTSSPEVQSLGESQKPYAQKAASTPESGNLSDTEVHAPKNDSASSQLPEDEVQLQRDSELEEQIIVRYVNKTGNLIVQIPSPQTLNLERAIAAEFKQPQPQASAEVIHQKGESRGH